MEHYIEIELRTKKVNIVLNEIYYLLHRKLADNNIKNVGMTFPKYRITLGNVIRVHSDILTLERLELKDYLECHPCKVSKAIPVPTEAKFRGIRRIQTKLSQAKLRRLIKRGSIKPEDIKVYKLNLLKEGLDNPYVNMISDSTKQNYKRFFSFEDIQDDQVKGDFDSFGISKTATLPWF